jgi:hypothetical protein
VGFHGHAYYFRIAAFPPSDSPQNWGVGGASTLLTFSHDQSITSTEHPFAGCRHLPCRPILTSFLLAATALLIPQSPALPPGGLLLSGLDRMNSTNRRTTGVTHQSETLWDILGHRSTHVWLALRPIRGHEAAIATFASLHKGEAATDGYQLNDPAIALRTSAAGRGGAGMPDGTGQSLNVRFWAALCAPMPLRYYCRTCFLTG